MRFGELPRNFQQFEVETIHGMARAWHEPGPCGPGRFMFELQDGTRLWHDAVPSVETMLTRPARSRA